MPRDFWVAVRATRLIRLFKLADVVCVPSRNEPFGIVVLEAWSAYKPVVVTQVGGPSEYVWHEVNGLKTEPNPNSDSLGLWVRFFLILSEPAGWAAMAERLWTRDSPGT